MSRPWFPSAQELRAAERYRDAGIPVDQAAAAIKAPVDWMRLFYLEKAR